MSKKYHPLGAHLTKNLRRVALFYGTLIPYNFGQNGRSWNFFLPIIKPAKSQFWENFIFGILSFFACVAGQYMSLHPNLPRNVALLTEFIDS